MKNTNLIAHKGHEPTTHSAIELLSKYAKNKLDI